MNILQKFLNHQLINIAEDENLTKLKKTCNDIVKKLVKNKSKVASYTLIAFDPEISADNIDVIDVTEIIVDNWKTFVPNTKDTPTTVVRAVILQSLQTLSEIDIIYACLIWLTGRNVIRHFKLGREKNLLEELLLDIGNKVQRKAENDWSLDMVTTNGKIENLEVKIDGIAGVLINKDTLRKKLEDASGPNNKEGTANYDSPNPHWSNQPTHWSHEFAPRAATGIALVINAAFKEQSQQLADNQSQIQDVLNQLISKVESIIVDTQNEILKKNSLFYIRTQLLWWKEAAYSKTFDESYKKVPDDLLEIILAIDYTKLVPYLYPTNADYFLRETHKSFIVNREEKIKILDLLPKLEEKKEFLQDVFGSYKKELGRISFLSFLKELVNGEYKINQFTYKTGINSETEISKSEFVLWMFHDSQAQKIVSIK